MGPVATPRSQGASPSVFPPEASAASGTRELPSGRSSASAVPFPSFLPSYFKDTGRKRTKRQKPRCCGSWGFATRPSAALRCASESRHTGAPFPRSGAGPRPSRLRPGLRNGEREGEGGSVRCAPQAGRSSGAGGRAPAGRRSKAAGVTASGPRARDRAARGRASESTGPRRGPTADLGCRTCSDLVRDGGLKPGSRGDGPAKAPNTARAVVGTRRPVLPSTGARCARSDGLRRREEGSRDAGRGGSSCFRGAWASRAGSGQSSPSVRRSCRPPQLSVMPLRQARRQGSEQTGYAHAPGLRSTPHPSLLSAGVKLDPRPPTQGAGSPPVRGAGP